MKPNPCVGKRCQNNCSQWSEEARHKLFRQYWSLGHQQQRDFIVSHAHKVDIKRRRVVVGRKLGGHAKTTSIKFYLPGDSGNAISVCKQFFLHTLDIRPRLVEYTLQNAANGFAKPDGRHNHHAHNRTPEFLAESVQTFIKSLPAVPSHYCRASTNRLYLPSNMQNLKRVYLGYKLHMQKQTAGNTPIASQNVFESIFRNEFNIGFHCPKKDKCNKCEKFKNIPTAMCSEKMKQEYDQHIIEKNATYAEHKHDQELCTDVLCASFDLQKVLNTPYGDSVLLFYTRKYAFYNFSVYESRTRRGFCYIWGEADAKRGSFEISTCLYKWLTSVDKLQMAKTVILYCDCCSGQNRNRVVVAMLRYALINCTYIETVHLKYLLPGHTYMPVDSIHATVEHFVRKRIVWAPSEWATIIRSARTDPEPYTVTTMTNDSFLNWGQIQRRIMPTTCRSDTDN